MAGGFSEETMAGVSGNVGQSASAMAENRGPSSVQRKYSAAYLSGVAGAQLPATAGASAASLYICHDVLLYRSVVSLVLISKSNSQHQRNIGAQRNRNNNAAVW